MKKTGIVMVTVVLSVLGARLWSNATQPQTAQMELPAGPAIVLIRGDNSPGCNAIHNLVEQAQRNYRGRVEVIQTEWSADNPLIEHLQIRFLPAVVFIDRQGQERRRIVGESPAVQAQLADALAQAEQLLLQ